MLSQQYRGCQRSFLRRALLLALCLFAAAAGLHYSLRPSVAAALAQKQEVSPDGVWRTANEQSFATGQTARALPQSYRALQLDRAALTRILDQAPLESARDGAASLTLPLPKGGFARFRIVESPLLEPSFAAQRPELKTYRGWGLDDPTATLRMSWTPEGLRAIILSAQGTVYLDPFAADDTDRYVSYDRRDFPSDERAFRCLVGAAPALAPPGGGNNVTLRYGTKLRIFRLALAATAEYTGAAGGVAAAQMKMLATITRVNAIYERDLAVRLVMIDNGKIVFTDRDSDPYTSEWVGGVSLNNNLEKLRNENIETLGSKKYLWCRDRDGKEAYGDGCYDVGHVFGIGDKGGAAGMGAGLERGYYKANGVTTSRAPFTGDPFDVGYVAHEIGHQFGASHTFSDCPPNQDQKVPGAAYEPGSGSTIMSYAVSQGTLCNAKDGSKIRDLQAGVDDYFHVRSLEEIAEWIDFVNRLVGPPQQQDTGITPPLITAGASYTIPRLTPFALTAKEPPPVIFPFADGAGAATAGALSYTWEEYDLGDPLFRSRHPQDSPTRSFPSPGYIRFYGNAPPETYEKDGKAFFTGERLPDAARTMNFQVTARDNRGGVCASKTQVKVDGGSGPFAVAAPDGGEEWKTCSMQTVRWDVANTSNAPVSCVAVRILLSTDGGEHFDYVLAERTANDGEAPVPVPNAAATRARVKVEAIGNIFFDISDADFVIRQGSGSTIPTVITSQPGDQTVCAGGQAVFAVEATGINLKYQWYKNETAIPNATESRLPINAVSAGDVGAYKARVSSSCGGSGAVLYSSSAQLSLLPLSVITSQPADAAVCAGQQARFSVSASGDIARYEWYKDGVFIGAGSTLQFVAAPANEGLYQAVAIDKCGRRAESRKARLSLGGAITITRQPVNVTACAGQSATFSVGATGGNLKYKWRKNGGNIPGAGAEGSSYTIPAVSAADAGAYSVAVYNGCDTMKESAAATLTIATGCPMNNAQFVSQSAPSSMQAGQLHNVLVTMKNTGTTTWTSAGRYKLGSQNPADNRTWGFNRVELPAHIPSAEPGREVTFSLPVYAPLTQGTYNLQWQMTQEGAGWFGSLTTNLSIKVGPPPPDNAWFVSQSAPLTMTAGQRYNVSITMKNTGSNTWTTALGYKLVSRGSVNWGVSEVPLPASVAPGAEATFNFTVTAPASSPAPYRFEWQMMRGGLGFGATSPSLRITVK